MCVVLDIPTNSHTLLSVTCLLCFPYEASCCSVELAITRLISEVELISCNKVVIRDSPFALMAFAVVVELGVSL